MDAGDGHALVVSGTASISWIQTDRIAKSFVGEEQLLKSEHC